MKKYLLERFSEYVLPTGANLLPDSLGLNFAIHPIFLFKNEMEEVFYVSAKSAIEDNEKLKIKALEEVEYSFIDKNNDEVKIYIDTSRVYKINKYDLYDIEQKYGKFNKIWGFNLKPEKYGELITKTYMNIENNLAVMYDVKFNKEENETAFELIYAPNHKMIEDYYNINHKNIKINKEDLKFLIKKQQIKNHKSFTEMDYTLTIYEKYQRIFRTCFDLQKDDFSSEKDYEKYDNSIEYYEENYKIDIKKIQNQIDFTKNQAFINELKYDKDLLSEKYKKEL
ncbi:Mbov_0400 family ICE element protein [Mesomycoplasma lagogenitalium]|uniref:Uncharacterized protein n=1 Tax=Mesomycoplasma lagogenitalium TaxID=171286 RepID=A0ABY8LSM5_9BACT|nr:hypothetical protein [Mesomycoplasma lagogenitalium]WGI36263.1 hypothetical protein QEG99_02170 [Mesomycoplasma lagogenitalium]